MINWRVLPPDDATQTAVLNALVQMRKDGKLQCVWCEGDKLWVRFLQFGDRLRITWKEAMEMTGIEPPKRKPILMESRREQLRMGQRTLHR